MSRADVMSDPMPDPSLPAAPLSEGEPVPRQAGEEPFNLLDGSIEPTDDSPTVISKPPQAIPTGKADEQFSGGLRGRRLAHFELIEPIGVGGMAAVLRARDTQLDRLVALKILPPEMASDAENVRRFHQEARSAARLDHENIARVFFCGEDQRLHFIAFEFVEGENLRTILERRGRLPVGEALHCMLQVAAGLAHASHRGVVHRDIKPSNIIVTPNGRAKLVDMGLARSLEPQHDMGLTQSGVTLGTFDYISPEQALEPRDADVRSDIYSLGCTFYHVLTGHPPVPEGTAAKKLHHHQHIKPPDPRQLVPDLPDEVAVILDRTMAKQPKDRYQTPEQLVHHLYLAARKLGAAAEVPEGVLAVEAALPNPPTGRPLALAALAAVAVIGLIFLLDQTAGPKADPAANLAVERKGDEKDKGPSGKGLSSIPPLGKESGPTKRVKPTPVESDTPIYKSEKPTAAELAEFLRQNKDAPEIIIELAGDLDLRDDRDPDLVISNPVVTLRSGATDKRPTIRYAYHSRVSPAIQVAFTIESKRCTVEGLRFVLDQTRAEPPMASLLFRGIAEASYQVNNCEFIQAAPSGNEQKRMTSVLVESQALTKLDLSESCFLGFASLGTAGDSGSSEMVFSGPASGGQDAITRRGRGRITATDCVFGPHAVTFRLEGAAPEDDGLVRLNHCSILTASQSAVFDLAEGADARIDCTASLFSHPGEPGMAGMAEGKGAILMRRASGRGEVAYKGRQNRYHQLDSYLCIAGVSEETVQRGLDQMRKSDISTELESSPWKDAQSQDQLRKLEKLAIRDAFAVNPQLPELRLPGKNNKYGRLVGVEKMLAFSYLDNLPSLKEGPSASAGRRELVVVAKREQADEKKQLYPTLGHALLDARPGDVILLRLDGEVKLDPLALSGDNLADLTIRANKGHHPVLTLSGTEVDAALFRVYNGKLRLEDLEIHLQPNREAFKSQAVVSFLGEGECVLKGCLITLDRAGRKAALSVAVLTEPGQLMKKADAEPAIGPRFLLENCFVRGQGNLISSRGGQPSELTVKNSLIALGGSLLNVEADKDKDAQASSLISRLSLTKVTTYLRGNLIRVRAGKELKSLAKIQCEPDSCLFVPAGDGALIHLEGPEGEERGLKDKLLDWMSGKNAYGGFTTLLEQQAAGNMMMMPLPSSPGDWKDFSREMDSQYSVKLTSSPASDVSLTQLLPSEFRTPESLREFGADIAALRSLSPLRGKSETRNSQSENFDFEDF